MIFREMLTLKISLTLVIKKRDYCTNILLRKLKKSEHLKKNLSTVKKMYKDIIKFKDKNKK